MYALHFTALQVYLAEDARLEMGLHREDLVALAYFLGSDYAEGVTGVGIVNAVEIVHAFSMHHGSSNSQKAASCSSAPAQVRVPFVCNGLLACALCASECAG